MNLTALIAIAIIAAGIAGFALVQVWLRNSAAIRHKAAVQSGATGEATDGRPTARGGSSARLGRTLIEGIACSGSLERALIEFMALTTLRCRMDRSSRRRRLQFDRSKETARLLAQAGLGGVVTVQGYAQSRLRLAAAAAAIGALVGLVFSVEFAFVLGGVGVAIGWMAPRIVVRGRSARRADELEHRLPEMLDVVALGLRGGLSFDRSLRLYVEHFTGELASGLASAENRWVYGLESRSEALRGLAATYDSQMFGRVVENIIRSLRFGASLAESLETTAVDARQAYQAKKQEQVAKAPVKIMLPTGTLILPAMLMLVMGPVLLELIGSF